MARRNPLQKFIDKMAAHTVRLVRNADQLLNADERGIASGLILRRPHGLVLLTAGHSFMKEGEWTLETNVVVQGQTLSLALPNLHILLSIDARPGVVTPIDVAWAPLDEAVLARILDEIEPRRKRKLVLPQYAGPIDEPADPESLYGYAAKNLGFVDPYRKEFVLELSYEVGMTFRGEREDGLFVFKLARPHQGHEYYSGASGAPIADESGRVVSILLGGEPARNELYGLPLYRYAGVIDATTKDG
ncbi:MAG: hypothetical protein M3Q69_00130 [Acidobacteriota bacterium]|nr:hypothetical protein [Acidobacteriota bacterium]